MSIRGEITTETFEYDGGREVAVYAPPEPPEAVVFAGDGQLISQWGGVLDRCLGERRARARHRAPASGCLRRDLLRLTGRGVPTAWCNAKLASARVPRRRHGGAVFP